MQGEFHLLRSEKAAREWLDHLIVNWDWKRPIAVQTELDIGTRTLAQNAAMHKHFENIAQLLNEAGLDQKVVFEARKKGVSTQWTQESVKENLYKPMMNALTKKKSTTQLNKTEVSDIDSKLDHWFADNFTEFKYPPFPNKEMLK